MDERNGGEFRAEVAARVEGGGSGGGFHNRGGRRHEGGGSREEAVKEVVGKKLLAVCGYDLLLYTFRVFPNKMILV